MNSTNREEEKSQFSFPTVVFPSDKMSNSRGTRGRRLYGKTLGALVVKGNKQSSSPNPQEVDKVRQLKSRLFQSSGKMDDAKTT